MKKFKDLELSGQEKAVKIQLKKLRQLIWKNSF